MAPTAVILAAGQGKRMRSDLAKVLHPLAGRPMIHYVIDAVAAAGAERIVVVIGHQGDRVRAALANRNENIVFAEQAKQQGTGHAVMAAEQKLSGAATVLVVPGDAPLLDAATLSEMLTVHQRDGAAATILTAVVPDPTGYGRIVRDDDGVIRRVVEHADATGVERQIQEINTCVGVLDKAQMLKALRRIQPANQQAEYYLWDIIPLMLADGGRVTSVRAADPTATLGINDRVALADAEAFVRRQILERCMRDGVSIVDPTSTYIDADVEIGRDTVIAPMTVLAGGTKIGARCHIGPGAQIYGSQIGDECVIGTSVLESCQVADEVTIGPFNHLRPGTILATGVRVGNFAELKNAAVGPGSKVPHHSYIGDAELGAGVNIGAGVVTVNYDGRDKHQTHIEDGAFVGCNVNLVAPVRLGPGSYVAAGSTVDNDVPPEALAIARVRQTNKEGWAQRRREADQHS